MRLNELNNELSPRKNRMRVGRGIGSGKGKTCGRGTKGQKARAGVSVNGFEGGQMPIYRRLPKRGFHNHFREHYEAINLQLLQKFVDAKKLTSGQSVNKEVLAEIGLIKTSDKRVKVLAKGKLSIALNLEVDAASEAAIAAVKKAGGSVKVTKVAKAPKVAKADDAAPAKKASKKKAAPAASEE